MITVSVTIDHAHGRIDITETDPHPGATEGAVTRSLERLIRHAHERARCAIVAEAKDDA